MKKILFAGSMLFTFCLGSTWGQSRPVKQYFLCTKSNISTDNPRWDNYWFNDSSYIFEQKAYFSAESADNLMTNKEYLTYKFTYFDLRTKECYDYTSFSDSATPVLYYKVEKGDTWFYPKKDDSLEIRRPGIRYQQMADTSIDGKTRQRLRQIFISKEFGFWDQTIFYFDCDKVINQFWEELSPAAKYFPPCFLTRIDLIVTDASKTTTREITEMASRDTLLPVEKKVFDAWRKNAQNNSLQSLTAREAMKFPVRPLKYKDHPFFQAIYEAELEQWKAKQQQD